MLSAFSLGDWSPSPPSLAGKDSISRSSREIFVPNKGGMNSLVIISSSGFKMLVMFGSVLRK